jgi:MFS family permease
MFAPGFVTGHLIRRFGPLPIMGVGALLNLACIAVALAGVSVVDFAVALFLLGVGWNFLYTGGTTLALTTFMPEEKDRAQGLINFCVFVVQAISSFSSGALVTTQGWRLLNLGSLVPVGLTCLAMIWLAIRQFRRKAQIQSIRS